MTRKDEKTCMLHNSPNCENCERGGIEEAPMIMDLQTAIEKAREEAIRECLGAWSKTKSKMEGKTADIDLITDLDVFEKTLKILLKK